MRECTISPKYRYTLVEAILFCRLRNPFSSAFTSPLSHLPFPRECTTRVGKWYTLIWEMDAVPFVVACGWLARWGVYVKHGKMVHSRGGGVGYAAEKCL